MPGEDRAIGQNGGQGAAGEGAGGDKLAAIATSIDAIKGVVGDLVTKVSDIERSVQERQDLAEIMRMSGPPAGGEYEDMSRFERQTPQGQQNPQGKPDDVMKIASNLEGALKKSIDSINRRIDDVVAQMQVRQLQSSKPDFDSKIRPLAFQVSKEPGMDRLNVEQITGVAEGRLALKELPTLTKRLEDLRKENEDLKSRVTGDKPGLFVGIAEPPKKMSPDEAFDDAFEKSGAAKLLR